MDGPKSAYRAVTRQIEVQVTPQFLPDKSSPENGYFFWAYTINVANLGGETVQLKTRHWRITDAQGRLQEVRGPGVVGEEPVLKPGENFEYTSGVPLPTPSGFMTGSYGMVTAAGEEFVEGEGRLATHLCNSAGVCTGCQLPGGRASRPTFFTPCDYLDAVRRAGGVPILLSPGETNIDEVPLVTLSLASGTALPLIKALTQGNPSVHADPVLAHESKVVFNPQSLKQGEAAQVVAAVRQALGS
jgi:ApaG protein